MSKYITKSFKVEEIKDAMDDWDDGALVLHKEHDWVSEDKYEYCTYILKEKATGNYFSVDDSRSGSYYSDWYYDSEDWEGAMALTQVEPEKVIEVNWVAVKKNKENK